MMLSTISYIAVGCYFATSLAQAMRFAGGFLLAKRNVLLLYFLAVFLHGYLLYRWIDTTHGQNLSAGNMFSFMAWLAGLFLLIAGLKKPIENLLLLLAPIAALSIITVLFIPIPADLHQHLSPMRVGHILLALGATSLLGIAGLQAILVYFQNYLLKHNHRSRWLNFLPPLESMEHLLFQIIWAGFIVLSIAMVSVLLLPQLSVKNLPYEKLIFTVAAWGLFAGLLVGHYRAGWRGPIAVTWTLAGSLLLTLGYFCSKLFLGQLL